MRMIISKASTCSGRAQLQAYHGVHGALTLVAAVAAGRDASHQRQHQAGDHGHASRGQFTAHVRQGEVYTL